MRHKETAEPQALSCYLMDYTIAYYSESVQEQILDLPDTLAARFIVLTRRMVAIGPNLGQWVVAHRRCRT
jgi:hypothetical protein